MWQIGSFKHSIRPWEQVDSEEIKYGNVPQVSIPRTVEVGEENIILNCDYHFDEEEAQQLEIKWYFNKDPAPFFQWIAGLPDSKE